MQLFDWYIAFNVENHVKVVTLDNIKENDYNLNIPLYVEKVIERQFTNGREALIDLKKHGRMA
jgi:type I restriction enzyme M protein